MTDDAPTRVQLSRAKGWRMPPNTVKVDRTTMFGNSWKVGTRSNYLGRPVASVAEAVEVYRACAWVEPHMVAWVQERLRGRNLACWCALNQPCHADVLLEIANGPTP